MLPNFLKNLKKSPKKTRVGMIHSLFGDAEGVSIVMSQLEKVLIRNFNLPKQNVFYLIGNSKVHSKQIVESKWLWNKHPATLLALQNYRKNWSREHKKIIEAAISKGVRDIESFVRRKKIDLLIVHNSSHPINFVMSVAVSRYFAKRRSKGLKTPKYVLWWHDSHLERDSFKNPSKDTQEYLIDSFPGPNVDYILFINSIQWGLAEKFFKKVDEKYPGFYERIKKNHDFVYNTTDLFIESFDDLKNGKFDNLVRKFLDDFMVEELFNARGLKKEEVLFCLQPTRMVHRKRIDFAIEYCYNLLKELKKKKMYKAIYFLVSGHDPIGMKKSLKALDKRLSKEFKENNFFLVFAEDYKTDLDFLDYPKIFAQLRGLATYFSDVEGFGNNLLEVLASGLVPIIYEYPVYKADIAKVKFRLFSLDKFKVTKKSLNEVIKFLKDGRMRRTWVNRNLKLLKENYSHDLIARKLKDLVIKED